MQIAFSYDLLMSINDARNIIKCSWLLFVLLVRTQLPQAVGIAYSLKMDKKDSCVVTYTGDGGTSEVVTQQVL